MAEKKKNRIYELVYRAMAVGLKCMQYLQIHIGGLKKKSTGHCEERKTHSNQLRSY